MPVLRTQAAGKAALAANGISYRRSVEWQEHSVTFADLSGEAREAARAPGLDLDDALSTGLAMAAWRFNRKEG